LSAIIKEVRIYNRALSDAEIKYNKEHPYNPILHGCVLWLASDTIELPTCTKYLSKGTPNFNMLDILDLKKLKDLKDPLDFLVELQREAEEIDKLVKRVDLIVKSIDAKLRVAPSRLEIKDKKALIEALERFVAGGGKELLDACHEYIMSKEDCQFCRTMISSAYSEARFGNLEKSRFMAVEVIKYYKAEDEAKEIKRFEKKRRKNYGGGEKG